jgi:OFA family oxalate/formate antiporter-like MFS transporter
MIHASGYRHTFLVFGAIQGIAILLMGALLVKPVPPAVRPVSRRIQQGSEYTPLQTVRTGAFWAIYLVYVLIGSGGMILTAQMGPIGHDLGIAAPMLTLAITIDNFANGITRPLCGFLSDRIGRENAMLLMFGCEGVAFASLAAFGRTPAAFVVSAALVFLFWGEIFSVFPAICGDTFGIQNATANNGLLYTAKGTCSLAVPIASLLVSATGSWISVLVAASVSSLAAGLLAKFVVAPMRRRMVTPRLAPLAVAEFVP